MYEKMDGMMGYMTVILDGMYDWKLFEQTKDLDPAQNLPVRSRSSVVHRGGR